MSKTHRRHYRMPNAFWVALASSAVLSIVMVIGATSQTNYEIEPQFNTLYICVANVLIFMILYPLNFWILRLRMKTMHKMLLCLVASLMLAALFTNASYLVEMAIDPIGSTSNPFILNLIVNLSAGLISFFVSFLINDLTEHQHMMLENEQLRSENLLIRYQTLQQQVSPHFLFNSLNTLDGLITTDPTSAHAYVQQLAATFRYSTRNQNEVTLADELEFTQSYIYMMQIRYGENLHIRQEIAPALLERRLPPISLQLLVENAIKHNVVSSRKPMTITIQSTPEGRLRVTNPIQPKADSEHSSGLGLENLAQRYHLLYQQEITIHNDNNTFTVEIPLMDVQ